MTSVSSNRLPQATTARWIQSLGGSTAWKLLGSPGLLERIKKKEKVKAITKLIKKKKKQLVNGWNI